METEATMTNSGRRAGSDPHPRSTLLFSGHMIDAPGRVSTRFPPWAVPIADRAIAVKLDELQAGPQDVAICGGACGGDLLFALAALQRGTRLEIYLPFDESTFLASSVDFAGREWRDRFEQAKAQAVMHMPSTAEIGTAADANPYEANNRRMLERAGAIADSSLQFICLWDGAGGDGPGGTAAMVREVRRLGGVVHWLDTRSLWS
jgi:hypothetical protein